MVAPNYMGSPHITILPLHNINAYIRSLSNAYPASSITTKSKPWGYADYKQFLWQQPERVANTHCESYNMLLTRFYVYFLYSLFTSLNFVLAS